MSYQGQTFYWNGWSDLCTTKSLVWILFWLCDLDLDVLMVKFRNRCSSGIVGPIDVKGNKPNWILSRLCDLVLWPYPWPWIFKVNVKIALSINGSASWHRLKGMCIIHWKWWPLPLGEWPLWDGWVYVIVTCVTSDVGRPLTHLVIIIIILTIFYYHYHN